MLKRRIKPESRTHWTQGEREPAVQITPEPEPETPLAKPKPLQNAADAARIARIVKAALGESGRSGSVKDLASHYQERIRRESKPLEASTPVGGGRKPKIRRAKKRRLIERFIHESERIIKS